MTFDETIAASRRLDALLKESIMPVTQAKAGISGLKDLTADIHNAVSEVTEGVRAEMAGMAKEIRDNGQLLIRKVQAERADAMAAFAELLGNERAGDDQSDS